MAENVTTIADRVLKDSGTISAAAERPPALATDVVDDLMLRLGGEFGHRFWSQMPNQQSRRAFAAVWAERLAGLGRSDIYRGLERMANRAPKDRAWPPGAIEFRELCLPTYGDFGMPAMEDAYKQATTREYEHPAVMWAATRCNHALRFEDSRQARRAFAREYAVALDKARGGFSFPPIPDRVGYKPDPVPPAHEQVVHARRMREQLRSGSFERGES